MGLAGMAVIVMVLVVIGGCLSYGMWLGFVALARFVSGLCRQLTAR